MATPVIIVPGIMGTRLVDRRGNSKWDPDPTSAMSKAAQLRHIVTLLDLEIPLRPNPRPDAGASIINGRDIRFGGNLVWQAYDQLMRQLSSPAFVRSCPGGLRLYVCGYDWRQSNAQSARRLQHVVETARRETRAAKVILVAHSMGGLVSRWFCRFGRVNGRPGQDSVAGLILLGSPTLGAPAVYRILRQSFATADDIADIALPSLGTEEGDPEVIGYSGRIVARLARRLPSLHEMLPGRVFCAGHRNWVDFQIAAARGLRDASDPERLYLNRHAGIPELSTTMFNRWRDFDRGVGRYVPPNTLAVYSSGKDTETMYRINGRALERAGTPGQNRGDERVPTASGSARGIRAVNLRSVDAPSVDHGGVANDSAAYLFAAQRIRGLCASLQQRRERIDRTAPEVAQRWIDELESV